MPILTSENDKNRVLEWRTNTYVGRGMIDGIDIDGSGEADREVSSVHAAIFWDRRSRAWRIQDLGSANGTTVDGTPVVKGESVVLDEGKRVAFGGSSWKVTGVSPPPAIAVCGDDIRRAGDDLLLLPDEGRPEQVVVRDKGRWFLRPYATWQSEEGTEVTAGTSVLAGGRAWRLTLPSDAASRTDRSPGRLADASLSLDVPPQMERIVPTLRTESGEVTLPTRRHHELWWLLAVARLADRTEGISPDEAGWRTTDDIASQLGLSDSNYLNVLVHRSREQLSLAGFVDYSLIVERRQSDLPELRTGVTRLAVIQRRA